MDIPRGYKGEILLLLAQLQEGSTEYPRLSLDEIIRGVGTRQDRGVAQRMIQELKEDGLIVGGPHQGPDGRMRMAFRIADGPLAIIKRTRH